MGVLRPLEIFGELRVWMWSNLLSLVPGAPVASNGNSDQAKSLADQAMRDSWPRDVRSTLLVAFRRMVTSNALLLGAAVLLVGGSFTLSFATDAWHWFQRSGALLVSIGAVLSTRSILRVRLTAMIENRPFDEVFELQDDPHGASDLAACFVGFWLVGFGTIIWAYGDLLSCIFGSTCI